MTTAIAARARAGASARLLFRIGISDDRAYDELAHQVVDSNTPGWTELRVDLSRYAGWQWSIFYHPDGRCWNLIFNVSSASAAPPEGLWARPAVRTDADAEHDFLRGPTRSACP